MKRAILYARVSTPKQAELYSLEYQIEQERAYAHDMGFTIVAEIRDDQSGAKLARDGLSEARKMLAANEADILITWKIDRLHRNYVNSVLLRDELKKLGKELHYAQSRTKSGETARERLPEDILAILAEIERDDIKDRTYMGKRRKAEKDKKWIGSNRPPYGYTTTGYKADKQMMIDEATARIVRLVYQWYVYGDQGQPLTVVAIANRLTMMGIPTPDDHIPNRSHIRKRAPGEWARDSVYQILKHPAYAGTFYQFARARDGVGTRKTDPETHVAVPVPAIVDAATFQAAKEKLALGRTLSPRGGKYEYLVARRISCQCGYKMRSETSTGSPKLYQYYSCPGKRGDIPYHTCDMPALKVNDVDAVVWQWVKQDIAQPAILERKLREIQDQQRQENTDKDTSRVALYEHKLAIEEEIARIGQLYAKRKLPDSVAEELLDQQNAKLERLNAEIVRIEQQGEAELHDDTILSLVAFSEEFAAHLSTVEESFAGRRTVVDGLDVSVTAVKKEDGIWLQLQSILCPEAFWQKLNTC